MKSRRRNAPLHSLSGLALVYAMLAATPANTQNETSSPETTPKYRNPTLPIEERVADLLPRMTLEEKVQQITGGGRGQLEILDPTGTFTIEQARATMAQ